MLKGLLFLFTLVCATVSSKQSSSPQQTLNQVSQTYFIPNQGQWNPELKYLARIGGMNTWIAKQSY